MLETTCLNNRRILCCEVALKLVIKLRMTIQIFKILSRSQSTLRIVHFQFYHLSMNHKPLLVYLLFDTNHQIIKTMFTKSTQYLKLNKLLINCKIRNSEYSITIKLCITLLLQHTVPRWSAAILASQYRSYIQNRFNKTTQNYTRSSFFSVCRSAYHQRTHNSAACVSPHAH